MDRDRVNQGNVLLVATKFHFPAGSDGKESVCSAGDLDSIPRLGRSPGGGNSNPLQYSFFFFSFIFISWRLITLQYCSGFCHTLTSISHGFTCVPHPPVFLSGESQGQKSLVGYSPWGHKESGMTERLSHTYKISKQNPFPNDSNIKYLQ